MEKEPEEEEEIEIEIEIERRSGAIVHLSPRIESGVPGCVCPALIAALLFIYGPFLYILPMKYLGIDFGLQRTGLAVTDAGGRMAFPRTTVTPGKSGTREAFFMALMAVIEQESPQALVVGLPVALDGSDSLTTRQVRNFVKNLKKRTTLPIFFMNETLSSFDAQNDLHAAGLFGSKAKVALDQQAAVRILESFLNQPQHARTAA